MHKFSEISKNNESYRLKCSNSKQENKTIYNTRLRESRSLDESKKWFDNQKKILCGKRTLFEDPFFPADNSLLYYSESDVRTFKWKRPKEICKNPAFIVDGRSRFDVVQGKLGDCWLLAATGSLSMNKFLMNQVIPEDQDFNRDYIGAFMFRLWQNGQWYDVIVDDRLPTFEGRLVYMHSGDPNEFWSALLEKAYAKLVGSYHELDGGYSWKAMETFTGGIIKRFNLGSSVSPRIWDIMVNFSSRGSLMCCPINKEQFQLAQKKGLMQRHEYSISVNSRKNQGNHKSNLFSCFAFKKKSTHANVKAKRGLSNNYLCATTDIKYINSKKDQVNYNSKLLSSFSKENSLQVETKYDKGLIEGHAYSITGIKSVNFKNGPVNLVRVRNPWGNEFEWNGAYSDKSPEWQEIEKSELERLELKNDNDGEFWMCYEDFIMYFSVLEICHLPPELENQKLENKVDVKRTTWKMYTETGQWQKNISVGGCQRNLDTFHLNPQFRFTVTPNETNGGKKCELIISVMQIEMNSQSKENLFSIDYTIYQVNDSQYDSIFSQNTHSESQSLAPQNVCGRHMLSPGQYIIVPSTSKPGVEANFLLRILCEQECNLEQSNHRNEMDQPI